MPSTFARASLLAALLSSALPANAAIWAQGYGHYFRQEFAYKPMVQANMDAILQSGEMEKSHYHNHFGSNKVASTMPYDTLNGATCSQVQVKADKSIYWYPSLGYVNPQNQMITELPQDHIVLYYHNRATDPTTNQDAYQLAQAFAPGFRMIAGNSKIRAPDPMNKPFQAGSQIVTWTCRRTDGQDIESDHWTDEMYDCNRGAYPGSNAGLTAQINFPYCWNGQDMDINDQYSHMVYPAAGAYGHWVDSGPCPSSHPHILPHLFIEVWFDVSNYTWSSGTPPLVLSQGDPTGYAFHFDFVNGWDFDTLQEQIRNCNVGESGESNSVCFDLWTDEENQGCTQEDPSPLKWEGWTKTLPGCNPIQSGPANAIEMTNCAGNSSSPSSASESAASTAASSAAAASPTGVVAAVASGAASQVSSIAAAVSPADNAVSSVSVNAAETSAAADDSSFCTGSIVVISTTIEETVTAYVSPVPTTAAATCASDNTVIVTATNVVTVTVSPPASSGPAQRKRQEHVRHHGIHKD